MHGRDGRSSEVDPGRVSGEVVVTHGGRAVRVRGPVAAGHDLGSVESRRCAGPAGEDVVTVGRIAAAVDHLAHLVERRLPC